MNPDKKTIVADLLERLNQKPYLLLVNYAGMKMPQFTEIRKRLRAVSARMHVTKNSYVKAAGAEKEYPVELQKDLTGQTAVVFGDKDVCAAARVIKTFAKEFERPVLKSGMLDGRFLRAEDAETLAAAGSRENLLARLLGMLSAPAASLVRVIKARVDKENNESGAPAPAPADAAAATS